MSRKKLDACQTVIRLRQAG